jgi:hypothetical protein
MRVRFLENGVILAVVMSSATQRSSEPQWPILVDVLLQTGCRQWVLAAERLL